MAALIYSDGASESVFRFSPRDEIRIGSRVTSNQLVLSARDGVLPEHAVVTRSNRNHLPVVVDLSNGRIRVTGVDNVQAPVVYLRVLRHGDVLQLGSARVRLQEVEISQLPAKSRRIGQECPFCQVPLRAPGSEGEDGDEADIIACPYCESVMHRSCWLACETCPSDPCTYPIRETIMLAFRPHMAIERALDQSSPLAEHRVRGKLVRHGQHCQHGDRRDQEPFQAGQSVAYCPGCQEPYHLVCFFERERCAACAYDIKALTFRVFGRSDRA
jgi:hypothetical protein